MFAKLLQVYQVIFGMRRLGTLGHVRKTFVILPGHFWYGAFGLIGPCSNSLKCGWAVSGECYYQEFEETNI